MLSSTNHSKSCVCVPLATHVHVDMCQCLLHFSKCTYINITFLVATYIKFLGIEDIPEDNDALLLLPYRAVLPHPPVQQPASGSHLTWHRHNKNSLSPLQLVSLLLLQFLLLPLQCRIVLTFLHKFGLKQNKHSSIIFPLLFKCLLSY